MLNLNHLNLNYKPFPHGIFSNVFSEDIYHELVNDFPPPPNLIGRGHFGGKKVISESNLRSLYFEVISKSIVYSKLYQYVKSSDFIKDMLDILNERDIDLKNTNYRYFNFNNLSKLYWVKKNLTKLKLRTLNQSYFSARFEFSYIALDGAECLKPHTDSPQKLLSLVVPILSDKDVNELKDVSLGTSIYEVINDKNYFNQKNKFLNFDDVNLIRRMPFNQNTMALIVKTFNSYHGVESNIIDSGNYYRKSLTINIEVINRNQGINLL